MARSRFTNSRLKIKIGINIYLNSDLDQDLDRNLRIKLYTNERKIPFLVKLCSRSRSRTTKARGHVTWPKLT